MDYLTQHPQKTYEMGVSVIFSLQMRKLIHRAVTGRQLVNCMVRSCGDKAVSVQVLKKADNETGLGMQVVYWGWEWG